MLTRDLLDEHRPADEADPLPVGAHRRRTEPARLRHQIEQSVVALTRLGKQVRSQELQGVALVGPVVGKGREVQP